MKKLLILILIVLLGTMAYMLALKNVHIAEWESTNLKELEGLNEKLTSDINQARELSETTYTTRIDELNQSIKELSKTKETYQSKVRNLNEEAELGIVSIKNYKIEYLWTKLANYAKDNNVWLKLDLVENGAESTYNLNITLKGSYIDITEVIFDIEKDDTLDFKIEEFKMIPSTMATTTSTPTVPNNSETITPADANKTNDNSTSNNSTSNNSTPVVTEGSNVLQATFSIKNVNIELN